MLLLHTTTERRASRRRRTVAAGFEHAVKRAERPAAPLSPEIPVDRGPVLESAERLLAIAGVLRSDRELPDAGVAEARRLLTDGAGPLYAAGCGRLSETLTGIETTLGLR